MRQKVHCDLIMTDRTHHAEFVHVEADSGDAAAKLAQTAIKHTEFFRLHATKIAAAHVIGIEPDPEIIRPTPEIATITVTDQVAIEDVTPAPVARRSHQRKEATAL